MAAADVLPMADLPAHLALAEVLRHLPDANHGLAQVFLAGTFPAPNSLFYLAMQPLLWVMDAIAAAKVVLLLLYFGLGAYAGARLARENGRDPAVGVLVPPLLLSVQFVHGFVDFLLAVPLLLLALAKLQAAVRQDRPWQAWWLTPLLFLSHIQGWLLLSAFAVAVIAVAALPWRAKLRHAVAVLLPGAVLAATWALRTAQLLADTSAHLRPGPTLDERLAQLPSLALFALPGQWDDLIFVALVAAVCGLRATTQRGDKGQPAPRSQLAPIVCTAWLLYLVLPKLQPPSAFASACRAGPWALFHNRHLQPLRTLAAVQP